MAASAAAETVGSGPSWAPAAASRSVSVARSGPVSELAPAWAPAWERGSASVSVARPGHGQIDGCCVRDEEAQVQNASVVRERIVTDIAAAGW